MHRIITTRYDPCHQYMFVSFDVEVTPRHHIRLSIDARGTHPHEHMYSYYVMT